MTAIDLTYPGHFHPALIRTAPELCQLVGNYAGALPNGDWFAMEKIDGWRCLYFAGKDGRKGLWTRNGIPIQGGGHIIHKLQLMEQISGESLFFDGEFVVGGTLASTKSWCERDWKGGGEAGTLHLFDCFTQAEWEQGGTERPLYERLRQLSDLYGQLEASPLSWEWRERTRGKEPPGPHVTPLSWEYVATHADAMDMANRVWCRGGEGLVLKRAEAGYTRARSNEWLKVKKAGVR